MSDVDQQRDITDLFSRVRSLREANEMRDARDLIDALLAEDPDNASAHLERARIHAAWGRTGRARRDLRNALELDDSLVEEVRNEVLFAPYLGDPFVIAELDPESPVADAILALEDEELEEARELLVAHLVRAPEDSAALYLLSTTLASEEKDAEALAAIDRCLAVRPDFTDAQFNRAAHLDALGRSEEALPILRAVLAREPDHDAAALNLVLILRRLGQHEEALRVGEAALLEQPGALMLRYKQAESLAILGKPDLAVSELAALVELDPEAALAIADNEHFAPFLEQPAWRTLIENAPEPEPESDHVHGEDCDHDH